MKSLWKRCKLLVCAVSETTSQKQRAQLPTMLNRRHGVNHRVKLLWTIWVFLGVNLLWSRQGFPQMAEGS